MELLILLSAILTALTGVGGSARAMEPQRVASSGVAVAQAVQAERKAVVRISIPSAQMAALVVAAPMMPAMAVQPRLAAIRFWSRRRE